MEWILGIVFALMLALLCYTVFWTSVAINKKGQPFMDSFFDALHNFWSAKVSSPKDDDSGKPKLN